MPDIVVPISESTHSLNACGSEITQWGFQKEEEDTMDLLPLLQKRQYTIN